jgi:hypothetical protein
VKYRLLVAVPIVPVADHAALYRIEVELAKLAALVGCAAAGLGFARGDYLRTAWLLLAQCYLLILANDLLFSGNGAFAHASWTPLASGVVILVANAGQLAGTVMIARVWRVAGFELAGSPAVRRAVVAAALTFALVAAGDLAYTSVRQVVHGQTAALIDVFSSIADIIGFSLIAPFVLTAVAFRGGSLGWTWALLSASMCGWLLFDASVSFGAVFSTNADGVVRTQETARLLACGFGMSAGLAQRLVLRRAPAVTALATAPG